MKKFYENRPFFIGSVVLSGIGGIALLTGAGFGIASLILSNDIKTKNTAYRNDSSDSLYNELVSLRDTNFVSAISFYTLVPVGVAFLSAGLITLFLVTRDNIQKIKNKQKSKSYKPVKSPKVKKKLKKMSFGHFDIGLRGNNTVLSVSFRF